MKRKINAILTTALIAVVLLVTLVSCSPSQAVDFFEYSTNNLGPVGNLVRLMHQWIGSYGWTVVVFTLFLKIIMLPIDFWQRFSSRKSTLKMQRIQPILEGIDKRYGANTQRANEEKQKLYKKQGYSMLGTCLPMILSMVIFFVMFAGLRNYSTYSTITTFHLLSNEYYDTLQTEFESMGGDVYATYKAEYDAKYQARINDDSRVNKTDEDADLYAKINAVKAVNGAYNSAGLTAQETAIKRVQERYLNEKESWLWIKNVWQPDTWAPVMPDYDKGSNNFSSIISMENYPDDDKGRTVYNTIRNAILEVDGYGNNGSWNGLMILPVLSVALSFLSMWISQRMEKRNRKGEQQPLNQQQQMTNRMMMIMMPAMMAVFGFMYTGAFAIYMVFNYTLSIISTIALRLPVEKIVEKSIAKKDEKENKSKASYMR